TADEDLDTMNASGSASAMQGHRVYLFYGRPQWPEQISTADADAVIPAVTVVFGGAAAGDLNGDGYADLTLMREHSVQFIFGGRERLQGAIDESVGTSWMGGDLPPPFAPGLSNSFSARTIGDVDGDGCTDIAV